MVEAPTIAELDARADVLEKTALSLVRAPPRLSKLLGRWRTSQTIGGGLLLHQGVDQSRDAK
jgi:hypothetical protein